MDDLPRLGFDVPRHARHGAYAATALRRFDTVPRRRHDPLPLARAPLRVALAGRHSPRVRWHRAQRPALTSLGNGLNSLASRHATSIMVALLNAAVPLWIVLLRIAGRERVRRHTLWTIPVGLAGVVLLLVPGERPAGTTALGVLLGLGGGLGWATGSYAASRLNLPANPLHTVGLQMLVGAFAQAVLAVAVGETSQLHPAFLDAVAPRARLPDHNRRLLILQRFRMAPPARSRCPRSRRTRSSIPSSRSSSGG